MQQRLRARALAAGVGMTAPETVFLSHDTVLDADVEIEPFVVFGPGVTVASRRAASEAIAIWRAPTIAAGAIIGPFARLRPGAVIGEGAHIGNFVEVKNSRHRQGRQGQSPDLSGRRHGGRGRQYRRRHHHLQL